MRRIGSRISLLPIASCTAFLGKPIRVLHLRLAPLPPPGPDTLDHGWPPCGLDSRVGRRRTPFQATAYASEAVRR